MCPYQYFRRDNVSQTLEGLGVRRELIDSMISVGNKIDKMENSPEELKHELGDEGMRLISCETGEGISKLIDELDQVSFIFSSTHLFVNIFFIFRKFS